MRRLLLIMILLVAVAINVKALTLEQCIEMALRNNKEILSAREDIAMADQTYYDVRGILLPQITLQGGYQLSTTWLPDSSIPPVVNFKNELDNTATHNDSTLADILTDFTNSIIPDSVLKEGSITGQIKFDQVLFSGGKLINGINAVNRYRSIQKLRFKLIEQDVISKTTELFYQTILSKKLYDIQQEAMNTASKHLERVEILNREGQVSEYDLLRAQLEVAKIRPDVVLAQNMFDLAVAALKKQIGFIGVELILDQEISLPLIQDEDLQTALNLAQSQRIELKLSAINTEISKIKYSAEKGNYLPVVGLTAGYSIFTSANEYKIENDDFGTAFTAGIGFSIPLFTGFSNTAKRSYAKHEYYKSKIQETDGKEMIDLEVRQAWQNLQYALESYQVQKENIKLSERSLELAQVRFENQVGIQLEVFDAQMTLNSVKLNYYNTIYKVIIANQKFRKAMGYIL